MVHRAGNAPLCTQLSATLSIVTLCSSRKKTPDGSNLRKQKAGNKTAVKGEKTSVKKQEFLIGSSPDTPGQ